VLHTYVRRIRPAANLHLHIKPTMQGVRPLPVVALHQGQVIQQPYLVNLHSRLRGVPLLQRKLDLARYVLDNF